MELKIRQIINNNDNNSQPEIKILKMALKDYLQLIRLHQWYKNLVVFLAIFFAGKFFDFNDLYLTIIAFFSLAFISSAGYIFNDLMDLKKDRLHPEKKLRPLAAKKISIGAAIPLGIILLLVGIGLAFILGLNFLYLALAMLIIAIVYTVLLKKILLADVLTISFLFVLRAIAGAIAINVIISPWLVAVPFFLALFISIGKRHSDMKLLKEKAAKTRKVLQDYTPELTNSLMVITTALLIISYALYSFLSEHNYLIHTLPFALFVIFRFYYLIISGSKIARNPEKMVKDRPILIGIILWVLITVFLIYI